jgi:hypothetical protein
MAAPVLYTAIADGLYLRNMGASWPWPAGSNAPLNPSNPFTQRVLAAGKIALAADDAVDNTTPAEVLRGIPGLRTGVTN